jgi:DNA-binding CsgD family transcriptional regulator
MTLRGRGTERDVITNVIQLACDGDGGALVIEGVAGSGKTSLVGEVLDSLRTARILRARARRREASLPLAAAHALLAPGAGPAWRAVRLVDRDLSQRGPQALDTLTKLARHRPVVCWLDDAQWTDPHSVDLLSFLAGRLDRRRVALLITQRPGGPGWDLPELRLPPLRPDASAELVAELAPGIDADVCHAIVAVAAGNPGAITDLTRTLTPAQRRGDEPAPEVLPATSQLRAAHVARLNALPTQTRRLLLVVAADPQLTAGELVRAADALSIDITALDPAERDGLVRVGGDEVQVPEPLLRAVVYEQATLSARRATHALLASLVAPAVRALLHRAALASGPDLALAQALVDAAGEAAPTPTRVRALVRAAELGADPGLAAIWLVTAARLLWDGGEPHRARGLLRRVQASALAPGARGELDLLLGEMELRGRAPDRAGAALLAAAGELPDGRRATALLSAGEALCLAGNYAELGAVADQALALRRPDLPREAELAVAHLAGLTAMFRADYATAAPSLRRAIALAESIDEPEALLRASMAAIVLGDDETAYRLAVRAVDLADTTGGQAMVPRALELIATAECALGRYEAATATLTRAVPLAAATGQESLRSTLVGLRAVIAAMHGDRDGCLAHVREARVADASRATALVEWALGVLDLNDGRAADAVPRLAGLSSLESGYGQLSISVAATPHLVEAYVRAGDPAAGRRALAIFDPWARQTGNPAWLGLAERCQALVATDPVCAEEHYRAALHQHQMARARFDRARTQLLYGQELRRCRRRAAAREHLRAAFETFEHFQAWTLAAQAEAELRATGERMVAGPARPSPATDKLTAQQRQIAELVAGGATNREIAAALVVSTRTVDYHVRNILTRLGLRSRIDLARLIGPDGAGRDPVANSAVAAGSPTATRRS